jgi:acetyl esterase/lipase
MMLRLILLSLLLFPVTRALAQKTIPLYEGRIPNATGTMVEKDSVLTFPAGGQTIRFVIRVARPELTLYLPEQSRNTGMAVIICPGGGYTGLAIDHEGHAMARKFQEHGIAGIVLKYRLPDPVYVTHKEIVPLQDAQRAILLVRERAKEWGIRPDRIGIAGSSAGGHLASTAGTHYREHHVDNPRKTSLRPDFMILNYPVISFADSLTHRGSRMNLVGNITAEEMQRINANWQQAEQILAGMQVDTAMIRAYSNELQVTTDTPPAFITHAVDDDVVKVQNALLFMAALQKNRVPVEAFFYARGGHGYGMVNPTSDNQWIDACLQWLRSFRKP